MSDSERPQDVGRPHRRKRRTDPRDAALLARWHGALRRDLALILDELADGAAAAERAAAAAAAQTTLDGSRDRTSGIDVKRAGALYDLGIKLARELGSDIDPAPPPGTAAPATGRAPKVARGGFG